MTFSFFSNGYYVFIYRNTTVMISVAEAYVVGSGIVVPVEMLL
jgi:hypothetical protein